MPVASPSLTDIVERWQRDADGDLRNQAFLADRSERA